jgi:hypothetical protein
MTYQEDLERREAEQTAQQLERMNREGWLQICAMYGIRPHEANYRAVKEYCHPLPVSVQGFRLMLDNPQAAATLDYSDDSKQIIREVLGLLREHGRYTQHDLKVEETKLRGKTKQQQRARLAEVRMKQAHAAKPVTQLKAELAEARKDHRRYPGFADLPAEIVPRGKVRAVRCDAKYIKSLPPNEIRRMANIYGWEQLNSAIRERV